MRTRRVESRTRAALAGVLAIAIALAGADLARAASESAAGPIAPKAGAKAATGIEKLRPFHTPFREKAKAALPEKAVAAPAGDALGVNAFDALQERQATPPADQPTPSPAVTAQVADAAAHTLVFSRGDNPGGVLNLVSSVAVGGKTYAVGVLPWDYGSFLPGDTEEKQVSFLKKLILVISIDGVDKDDDRRGNWLYDRFYEIGAGEVDPTNLYTMDGQGAMHLLGTLAFSHEDNHLYVDIPTKLLFVFLGHTNGIDLSRFVLRRGADVGAADPNLHLSGILSPEGFGDRLPEPYQPSADRGAVFVLGPHTTFMRCGRMLWRFPPGGSAAEAVGVTNGGLQNQLLFTNLTKPLFQYRLDEITKKFRKHVD